ncbi:hypothetical protein K469DRAFT_570324, partial [Zopfia rhizophila CBS 207.26]
QSPYFAKAFQEAFVEGSTGTLEFQEGSGIAPWRVFEYLYTGDYSDELSNKDLEGKQATNTSPATQTNSDLQVYALADMFFLEDLKALALKKFQQKSRDLWMSDSVPECIREVYKSTYEQDRGIRSAVVEVAASHVHDLSNKGIFKNLVREGGDFVVDYFENLRQTMKPNKVW